MITKVSKIIQIADTHIRLYKRHDEYRKVFNTLYNDLQKVVNDETIIVLLGDILHAKNDLSPELIQMTNEFFTNLADIAPTYIITGNHDVNLSNTNRLDSLSPIIESIGNPNLTYWKRSGIYNVGGVDFYVNSILDPIESWPVVQETNTIKVGLYHGQVYGAFAGNFTVTNQHVQTDRFDGMDMVLLGDLHTYQTLQPHSMNCQLTYDSAGNEADVFTVKPIITYSGSPIQQNFGEPLEGHGWCEWDVQNRTHIFHELHNDFGYVTIDVSDGSLSLPTTLPKNVRLRIFTGELESTAIKKIIATIKNKTSVIEVSVSKGKTTENPLINRIGASAEIANLTDINVQETLLTDWLSTNDPVPDDKVVKEVLAINKALNSVIEVDDHSRNISWQPLTLKFSNMFSYGEDNEIDFSSMDGLYGIFAPNATGKSSIMDALMFCLYDKTPRAFKGDHIMNNRKNTFRCELTFKVDNIVYLIRRSGSRKPTGEVKVDVEFLRREEDDTHTSLNGLDRRDTNANIRAHVGTYEDFILTAFSGQTGNTLFIDKSHSERKDLLCQFMGLNIFDKLSDLANEESKGIHAALKRFKKEDFTERLINNKVTLELTAENYTDVVNQLDSELQEFDKNTTSYHDLIHKKIQLTTEITDIKKLELLRNTIYNSLFKAAADQAALNVFMTTDRKDLEDCVVKLAEYDEDDIEASYKQYDEVKYKLDLISQAKITTANTIVDKKRQVSHINTIKYNKKCDVCLDNNKKFIQSKEILETELKELDIKLFEIDLQIEAYKEILLDLDPLIKEYQIYKRLQKRKVEVETKILNGTIKREQLAREEEQQQRSMDTIDNDIAIYKKNESAIVFNQDLQTKIGALEQLNKVTKKSIDALQHKVTDLSGELKVLRAQKELILEEIKETEELEQRFTAYRLYLAAVGRNGIPHSFLQKVIPNIESEINEILGQIVGFSISLEVDGKNINGFLNYDYERIWPLENSSGMERFISGLAIRVALMKASNLPKPNFLIIDEGMSVLDSDNFHNMGTLMTILKNEFDFILLVSHLDAARDLVDNIIEISVENGYSSVKFD